MTFDAMVLRAMLRLARRRQDADEAEVALRVNRDARAVRAALRRLEGRGFVERRANEAPRLTLSGLALAVALLPVTAARRSAQRTPRAA